MSTLRALTTLFYIWSSSFFTLDASTLSHILPVLTGDFLSMSTFTFLPPTLVLVTLTPWFETLHPTTKWILKRKWLLYDSINEWPKKRQKAQRSWMYVQWEKCPFTSSTFPLKVGILMFWNQKTSHSCQLVKSTCVCVWMVVREKHTKSNYWCKLKRKQLLESRNSGRKRDCFPTRTTLLATKENSATIFVIRQEQRQKTWSQHDTLFKLCYPPAMIFLFYEFAAVISLVTVKFEKRLSFEVRFFFFFSFDLDFAQRNGPRISISTQNQSSVAQRHCQWPQEMWARLLHGLKIVQTGRQDYTTTSNRFGRVQKQKEGDWWRSGRGHTRIQKHTIAVGSKTAFNFTTRMSISWRKKRWKDSIHTGVLSLSIICAGIHCRYLQRCPRCNQFPKSINSYRQVAPASTRGEHFQRLRTRSEHVMKWHSMWIASNEKETQKRSTFMFWQKRGEKEVVLFGWCGFKVFKTLANNENF